MTTMIEGMTVKVFDQMFGNWFPAETVKAIGVRQEHVWT